ncbi:hypothetical protein BC834DRAFT_965641 [Gloeopeniophorella convolvens]|nr:hypothetical protein BC834DRAFT_965641 [Gloeopeniophorella convolvens]
MSRSTLRPCLKHCTDLEPLAPINTPFPFAACPSVISPRVHFPPTPGLCQTHLTHSAAIYDRAPIVVLPNTCALPERGGRTYTSPSPTSSCPRKRRPTSAASGTAYHPQAFKATSADPAGPLPALVPDLSSSESDESDSASATPPEPSHFPSTGHAPISIGSDAGNPALAFLPYAGEQESPRRKRSPSRARGARSVRRSEFAVPDLDGCLGGF